MASARDGFTNQTIILFDIDCFEVQKWTNDLRPDLKGQDLPIVVINHDGRILSVNYTAKSLGVQRSDGLRNARDQCNQHGRDLIELVAPERYGKVDTFSPQIESDLILTVLQDFQRELRQKSLSIVIERSSRDEFYIDVTELVEKNLKSRRNSWYGYGHRLLFSKEDVSKLVTATKSNPCWKYWGKPVTVMETELTTISGNQLAHEINEVCPYGNGNQFHAESCLVEGAIVAQTLIERIRSRTACNYQASAGIGHSKLVAKLACSRNKPEGITIITDDSCQRLMGEIEFQSLPGYGSNIGLKLLDYYDRTMGLGIPTLSNLLHISDGGADFEHALQVLQVVNPEVEAKKLRNMCFLLDARPVEPIVHSNTFGTSMPFKKCRSWETFDMKIENLAADMEERIEYSQSMGRTPTELVVKAEKARKSYNAPSDVENKIELGTNMLPFQCIYNFIHDYCVANNLRFRNISKIILTAKGIVVPNNQ